jgi:large subunit ribosomal protein L9
MPKNIKLLLIESVDSLGIVGDVVNVRTGYARNFLLPRNLATTPNDELIKNLAGKRAEAERQVAELRKHREETNAKIVGLELTTVRSCNDQGILYGAITQQEICKMMSDKGYQIKPREVRIHETIKRVGTFEVHIKLDTDLDAVVKIKVDADRELEPHRKEADSHHGKDEAKPGEGKDGATDEGAGKAEGKEGKDGKPEAKREGRHDGKHEGGADRKSDRPRREDREDRPRRGDKLSQALAMANSEEQKKTGWGASRAAAAQVADMSRPKTEGEAKSGGEHKSEKHDGKKGEKKGKKKE